MRKVMGHTAVPATEASSVTLWIWQHGAKENYSNFKSVNMIVDTKTRLVYCSPIGVKCIERWLENKSKPIAF